MTVGFTFTYFYDEFQILLKSLTVTVTVVPLPTGFARKAVFWKMVFVCGVVAALMAVFACGFINFIDNIPPLWASCDFKEDASCGDW